MRAGHRGRSRKTLNVGLVDCRVWLLGIRLSSVTRASAIGVDIIHIKGAWVLLTIWIMYAFYLMIVLDETNVLRLVFPTLVRRAADQRLPRCLVAGKC